jgi:hypothetical protein
MWCRPADDCINVASRTRPVFRASVSKPSIHKTSLLVSPWWHRSTTAPSRSATRGTCVWSECAASVLGGPQRAATQASTKQRIFTRDEHRTRAFAHLTKMRASLVAVCCCCVHARHGGTKVNRSSQRRCTRTRQSNTRQCHPEKLHHSCSATVLSASAVTLVLPCGAAVKAWPLCTLWLLARSSVMADLAIHRRACPQAVGTHAAGVHEIPSCNFISRSWNPPLLHKRARVGRLFASLVLGSAQPFASLVGLHSDLYQAWVQTRVQRVTGEWAPRFGWIIRWISKRRKKCMAC